MQYTSKYQSPLGEILIAADNQGLIGLWFVNQKYFADNLDPCHLEQETKVLKDTKRWLDIYFSGRVPNFQLPLHFTGTAFQNEVWKQLLEIPYGNTTTYQEISDIITKKLGKKSMSAQAIGGAVGKNKISIIVPCHRVVGTNGNLTGYAGGINKKIALLKLENGFKEEFFIQSK